MTPTLAWHFVPEDRRLQHGDGRIVEAGQNYTHIGPLKMCRVGMHASIDAIDALQYAPGPIICRVEMGGHAISGPDKIVASERHVLWVADATDVLVDFATWCASRATRTARATRAAEAWATARAAAQARAAAAWAAARAGEWALQNDELTRLLLTLAPGDAP